ncbi:MAG: NAD regulator [Pseudomonadota bacterium]
MARAHPSKSAADNGIVIGLSAVIAAVIDGEPHVLSVRPPEGHSARFGRAFGLPFGPFDPTAHRTFEIGVRAFIKAQTDIQTGYVEQLYTFGDRGREAPIAALDGAAAQGARIVSVGYLALAPVAAETTAPRAAWRPWRAYFPWEDWRDGAPDIIAARIIPALQKWAARASTPVRAAARKARIKQCFGLDGATWDEEKVLERYELMYEAGLAAESWRDQRGDRDAYNSAEDAIARSLGEPMVSDHRRILATAIGRLRGKLKYRPVVFELMPDPFTLLDLQHTVEAISGFTLHKQNFRRLVEKSELTEPTGQTTSKSGGRPAALFRYRRDLVSDSAVSGLAIPRPKLK